MSLEMQDKVEPKLSSLTYTPKIPENYWDHSLNMNYLKALKELIDNALNNREDNKTLTFIVQHFIDSDKNISHIMFHDDGMGVDVSNDQELDGWIGVKHKKTKNQLSTHGVGMKHSLASFDGTQGVNWVASNHQIAGFCSFDTICSDMELYRDDRFWKLRPPNMHDTGMSACVQYNPSNIGVPKKSGDATTVMGDLGATYKHYLESNYLKLCFQWIKADGTIDNNWIEPKNRPYVTKGKGEPIYRKIPIEAPDKSWKVLLTFGKNGNNNEIKSSYPNMDADEIRHIVSTKRHPYGSSSRKTGMDIVEHDRVIELNAKHILTEYDEQTGESKGDDKMTRFENVAMGGEVVLVRGFETTETKEIKRNIAYRQMCNAILAYLKGGNTRKVNHFQYDPAQSIIQGNKWRDAVGAYLTDDDARFEGETPIYEDPITGYNMNHDIRIAGLPIECKACEIEFNHVSKFRSQLEIENLTEGWIVTSEGITADALREVQRLQNLEEPINIVIKNWSSKAARVLQILDE